MITGFEKQTQNLTQEELDASKLIIRGLEQRIGKGKSITSGEIIKAMTKYGYNITGPRLRKIINYIRNSNQLLGLAANSDGYYIIANREEFDLYIKSLQERIDAQVDVLVSLKKQYNLIFEFDSQLSIESD